MSADVVPENNLIGNGVSTNNTGVTDLASHDLAIEPSKGLNFWVIAVIVLLFIGLLYYGYTIFMTNCSDEEAPVDVDSNVLDYNLQDTLDSLEQLQSKLLKNLSHDTGI